MSERIKRPPFRLTAMVGSGKGYSVHRLGWQLQRPLFRLTAMILRSGYWILVEGRTGRMVQMIT